VQGLNSVSVSWTGSFEQHLGHRIDEVAEGRLARRGERLLPAGGSETRADPRDELLRRRLADVVVGALRQADHGVGLSPFAVSMMIGTHRPRIRLQPPACSSPSMPGSIRSGRQSGSGAPAPVRPPVLGGRHLVVLLPELVLELEEVGLVIDDQDQPRFMRGDWDRPVVRAISRHRLCKEVPPAVEPGPGLGLRQAPQGAGGRNTQRHRPGRVSCRSRRAPLPKSSVWVRASESIIRTGRRPPEEV
jgi:hypothetical protein